jgi:hypothetical protein
MALFKDINNGSLDLNNLNFGIITLLIKQKETTHIKRLFHISLLNASIKIFAKVGANRIIGVTPHVMAFLITFIKVLIKNQIH